jgi:hypothetical protein
VSEPLTEAEFALLDLLRDAHNAFAQLPEHHPNELREWAADLHHLQQRIMCRAARRSYPDIFTPMEPTP